MARTVQGITHTWQVSDSPIGSGDAGEVYAVVCQDQPDLTGVMKKPSRIATAGTIQRQAGQIANEALALQRLDGLSRGKAHPPRLLDQAPDFTHGTAFYFIVSETAPGEDLDSILAETRKTGKPFPRRVIMTVLDALFDMFSRAHAAGVLWNDVKLDHIYWHNATGQVGVIDWGNALFLDSHDQHKLPRWEDYQQMIDTLGNFLQRSAPELYVDLGWEEFQGQNLNSTQVSVLARRITYQQQVIAHQVMEYQSLIRVVLSAEPSLEGLQKIAGYQEILEKSGAPWNAADVLKYSQSLVESVLNEDNFQVSVRIATLVWDIFDESLDLPWHLMREYCRYTDILTHPAYGDLAILTLKTNWNTAIWAASKIASQSLQEGSHLQEPVWWGRIIPVMRQQALGTATPPPLQSCRSLLKWAQSQQEHELTQKLDGITQRWRQKGSDLTESPFDYALLDIIRHEKEMPIRLRSEVKQSFAAGEQAIRELIKVWSEANWDELPKAFHKIIGWDPDRWGILLLSDQVESFQTWCQYLFNGPGHGTSVRTFLEQALETRPKVERLLGSTHWMNVLLNMLKQILQGSPISLYQSEAQTYCPWLLQYPDIHAADARPAALDQTALRAHLRHFIGHLRNWSDVDAGLDAIKEHAPEVYSLCCRLVEALGSILSLNVDLDRLSTIAAEVVPHELDEGSQVLQTLISWRLHIDNGNLPEAINTLNHAPTDTWVLAKHARQVTEDWLHLILPILKAIQSATFNMNTQELPSDPRMEHLLHIFATIAELKPLWSQMENIGVHTKVLEALEDHVTEARSAFLEWRTAFESSTDQLMRLLYHRHLDLVRQVSNRLLRMTQHIRQAKLAFTSMDLGNQATLTVKLRLIDNILDHLTALETEFITNPDERRYPEHQNAFHKILNAQTSQAHQSAISALTESHPFYAWLVKSTLAENTSYS